jgi:signal peptidase
MKNKFKSIKKNKVYKIIKGILKTILSFFVVVFVSIIFIQRFSDNNISLGGYRIFTIITESMVPKYQVGDMIISKEVSVSDIKVGDDVVYIGASGDFKDKIVTHQVIEIDKEDDIYYFHTKGIANTLEDPLVSEEQIYGVVKYKFVFLSKISKLINNIYGFYFIIFVPFVVLLFFEIMDVIHGGEKLKNK